MNGSYRNSYAEVYGVALALVLQGRKRAVTKTKRAREDVSDADGPGSKRTMAADLRAKIEQQIRSTHVLMYCKTTCPFCAKVYCTSPFIPLVYLSFFYLRR